MPNTTVFMRSDSAQAGIQPSTFLAGWSHKPTIVACPAAGGNQAYASTIAGSGKVDNLFSGFSSGGQTNSGIMQYVTDPLSVTTFNIGDAWSVGIRTKQTVTSGTFRLDFWAGLIKADGTLRSALTSGQSTGAAQSTTSETTCYSASLVSFGNVTSTAGDRLCFEFGYLWSSSYSNDLHMYDCGTTAITSDSSSTGDQSFVTMPYAITFSGVGSEPSELTIARGICMHSRGPTWARSRTRRRKTFGGRLFDSLQRAGGQLLGGPILLRA